MREREKCLRQRMTHGGTLRKGKWGFYTPLEDRDGLLAQSGNPMNQLSKNKDDERNQRNNKN